MWLFICPPGIINIDGALGLARGGGCQGRHKANQAKVKKERMNYVMHMYGGLVAAKKDCQGLVPEKGRSINKKRDLEED